MHPMTFDLASVLWVLLATISGGFIGLAWFVIRSLSTDIKTLTKGFNDYTITCTEKFRTKEESRVEWNQLRDLITELKTVQKERHEQIWKKMDNQTALFMQEKGILNETINNTNERVARLEYRVSEKNT